MLAYFDCFSGISGDMTLGALLDLGVPLPWLRDQLAAMPLKDFRIDVQTVHRSGIAARQVMVADDGTPEARCHEDIKALIASSPLPESVKRRSLDIFRRLAVAEAGIHGCEVEAVHFHEVGATDAIVDIVGAALCLDYLKISEVCASRIPLGRGFVTCSHGRISRCLLPQPWHCSRTCPFTGPKSRPNWSRPPERPFSRRWRGRSPHSHP